MEEGEGRGRGEENKAIGKSITLTYCVFRANITIERIIESLAIVVWIPT